jgi:cation transporter-like permease
MNRNVIAIIASVVAISAILAGTYGAFFALAAQIPAGRTLGLISAALMVASGLACAGVGYLASRWAQRRPDLPG